MKAILPYRIIVDHRGVKNLYSKLGKDAFSQMLYDLLFINTNSLQHKKNHIITSNKSFEEIDEHLVDRVNELQQTWLRAAIRPQNDEKLEEISEETERIWEYAILVSTERPYRTIIITDTENKKIYDDLKEKDKKENIIITTDENSIKERIGAFFLMCREYKQN